jgi:hypothetical protein
LSVIPGRTRERANPESITPALGVWIPGSTAFGGHPGMTEKT